jgi:GTPase SAR1 family protein
MNPEEALQVANQAVFEGKGKHLTDVQRVILLGSLRGQTYAQIAKTNGYCLQHIKNEGKKLWKLLSDKDVLRESVNKTNFQGALERRWQLQAGKLTFATLRQHWDAAPDVSVFYGRTEELAKLETWIVQERCRTVVLLGMGGIGKTTLSVKLAEQIQDKFEYLIWRSLRYSAPPIQELLADLIQFLSNGSNSDLPENVNSRITYFIKYLNQHRCLLVLDAWEKVLGSGDLAGQYRQGYEDYGQLLRRVGEEQHQSCLFITSLDKTQEISLMAGEKLLVRSIQLGGLGEAAKEIFREKELPPEEESTWETLIQYYRGNPLILKIVSTRIKDFYGLCSNFLKGKTFVFREIRDLLDRELTRLTKLEKNIMRWMANKRKPVSPEDVPIENLKRWIPEDLPITVLQSKLIDAMQSLLRRSLIEKNSGEKFLFTLQPVVMEYVADKFPDEESIT